MDVVSQQVYRILRVFPAQENKLDGLKFILEDEKSKITFNHFIPNEKINNEYKFEKTKKKDIQFEAVGVEGGTKSSLIVETGFIKKKKTNLFLSGEEMLRSAKKYRFILRGE